MKNLAIIIIAVFTMFFASCDKGDIEVRKLNRGDGTWTIESIVYQNYDSTGTSVTSTTTVSNVGEFVFFKTTTLSALYDEHFVTVFLNDTSGAVNSYYGGVYYDDNRAKIAADSPVDGVWTVADNGRKKQEWNLFIIDLNTNLLAQKQIMSIKKK